MKALFINTALQGPQSYSSSNSYLGFFIHCKWLVLPVKTEWKLHELTHISYRWDLIHNTKHKIVIDWDLRASSELPQCRRSSPPVLLFWDLRVKQEWGKSKPCSCPLHRQGSSPVNTVGFGEEGLFSGCCSVSKLHEVSGKAPCDFSMLWVRHYIRNPTWSWSTLRCCPLALRVRKCLFSPSSDRNVQCKFRVLQGQGRPGDASPQSSAIAGILL